MHLIYSNCLICVSCSLPKALLLKAHTIPPHFWINSCRIGSEFRIWSVNCTLCSSYSSFRTESSIKYLYISFPKQLTKMPDLSLFSDVYLAWKFISKINTLRPGCDKNTFIKIQNKYDCKFHKHKHQNYRISGIFGKYLIFTIFYITKYSHRESISCTFCYKKFLNCKNWLTQMKKVSYIFSFSLILWHAN